MAFNDANLGADLQQSYAALEIAREIRRVFGGPEKKESPQLEWLKEDSGYVLKQVGRGPDSENEEERKEKEARKDMAQSARQSYMIAGLSMTMEEIHDSLDKGIDLLTHAASRPLPEITKADFLYVDAQGNVVSANHPGARQVETAEEKAAIEAEKKMCFGGATADQATMIDGRLVSADAVLEQTALQANADELKEWNENITAGTANIDDAPQYVQDQIREQHETGTLAITQEPIATINGQDLLLPDAAIARYEAEQRYTAPAPGMSPAAP